MKIQRVTFLGLRGVRDASLDFTNPGTGAPHDLVLLTGPSASGKTRALEAILAAKEAIAPYGPMVNGGSWLRAGEVVSKVAFSIWLDEEERLYAGTSSPVLEGEATFLPGRTSSEADEGLIAVLGRYAQGRKAGKVEYFPSSRRIPTLGPFNGLSAIEQRAVRASKDARKYSFVIRFLRELSERPDDAARFAERLESLSPTCRYERIPPAEGLPRCFRSRGGELLGAAELSDSEADAVLLAATAVAIDLHCSLVLLDRPGLHADPGDLAALPDALRALGENNQILAATTAPELLAAVGSGQILRLEAP